MTLHIGFLLYPNVTQLDATGPAQVLRRLMDIPDIQLPTRPRS